jgi:hypothetical protein
MTHVAVVCDRADVQLALPQFVVGNERTFLQRDLPVLRHGAPPNVTLVRQKSAWNNILLTVRIVRALGVALGTARHLLPNTQALLMLDAAKIHLHPRVLRACRAVGLWLLVIPPRMTFALQPLDAYIFALFKAWLIAAYQAARLRSANLRGDVDIAELLGCVYDAIANVLEQRPWATAFDYCGFGSSQSLLGSNVRRALQLESSANAAPVLPPSDEQVRVCFPRNYNVQLGLYRSLFDEAAPRPVLRRAAPIAGARPGLPPAAVPWREPRTRSEHRHASAAADAVARLTRTAPAEDEAPVRPLLRRYRYDHVLDAD